MKTFIAALAIATTLSATTAWAGDNSCRGEILLGGKMTDHSADDPDSLSDCKFDPSSVVGKRILRACPVGSICEISLPIDGPGQSRNPIKRIDTISRNRKAELFKAKIEALPPELKVIHQQLVDDYNACGTKQNQLPGECKPLYDRYIQFRRKHGLD